MNFFNVEVVSVSAKAIEIKFGAVKKMSLNCSGPDLKTSDHIEIGIRPEDISVIESLEESRCNWHC